MEEKSIDELRREAQELYQAKLLAYQQSQKQEPKEVAKEPITQKENAKPVKPEFLKIKIPFNAPAAKTAVKVAPEQALRPKNNWFVVIVFALLTIVVLVKVMVIKP